MDRKTANTLAKVLGVAGVLFMVSMAFQIINWRYAIFLGVACFIIAGAIKKGGDD